MQKRFNPRHQRENLLKEKIGSKAKQAPSVLQLYS